jgi:hypothetical protein
VLHGADKKEGLMRGNSFSRTTLFVVAVMAMAASPWGRAQGGNIYGKVAQRTADPAGV